MKKKEIKRNMKILPPTNFLPPSKYQGRTNYKSDYDEIIEQTKQIAIGTHLPIECKTKKEVDNVRNALHKRINRHRVENGLQYGDMSISIRGLTVYVTRHR